MKKRNFTMKKQKVKKKKKNPVLIITFAFMFLKVGDKNVKMIKVGIIKKINLKFKIKAKLQ